MRTEWYSLTTSRCSLGGHRIDSHKSIRAIQSEIIQHYPTLKLANNAWFQSFVPINQSILAYALSRRKTES